ncbi:outer membrane beta-barrel protein [Microbulbifer pacificus]|uniref:outer membrane beta-barrel protein n=1 Tax=Microbulbifer pacificus TaxID=407164 RepID=UPI000CF4E84C|nr:outer membrane beta-barrel protein [Microbulbifer pacificus]
MTKLKLSAAVCLITSFGAGAALAQTEAAAVKLGSGINFTPTLNIDLQNDDNVTNAETNTIESVVAVINPNFLLSADDGVSAYSVNYSLLRGEYFDSEDDNYTDHFVTGTAGWELNARNRLELFGNFTDGHEPRGTGFSQGSGNVQNEPDRFKSSDINGTYTFGAETAKGQLVLNLGTADKDYEGGMRTAGRDRGTDYGSVTFNYNTGGRTRLLAEVGRREIGYDYTPVGVETLDSAEMRYQVGVTWEGTAKTTGTIKVGSRSKDFVSGERKDYTGPSWEAGIRWTPKTYSAFDFNTARRSDETSGVGNFIDVESYTLSWHHSWADRLSSQVTFDHSINDYLGSRVEREEDINTGTLRLNYQAQRWLAFNAGISVSDKDSSAAGFSYEKNLTFIGLQASL